MKSIIALLVSTFVPLAAAQAPVPPLPMSAPTAKCNDRPVFSLLLVARDPADPRVAEMDAAIKNPTSNPALFERLGRPLRSSLSPGTFYTYLVIYYDAVQDFSELSARFAADPVLAEPYRNVDINGPGCGLLPFPRFHTLVEFYHAGLNHFFMTALPEEIAWINAGGAGGGWRQTGESWQTEELQVCDSVPNAARAVYRFFTSTPTGRTSHFFTVNNDECSWLRNSPSGWNYLTVAFGAMRPVNGQCPSNAPVAMMRVYNNRAAQNDSNFRFVSNPAIYSQMQRDGWIGEGVQFCVKSAATH